MNTPANRKSHNDIAVKLWLSGDLKGMEAALTAGLAANPTDPNLLNNLGIYYHLSKDFDAAVESYEKCIRLNPSYLDAYENLSHAHYARGDQVGALKAIKMAQLHGAKATSIYLQEGILQKQIGRARQAHESFLKVLEQEPGNTLALLNIANIELESGNLSHAKDLARQCLSSPHHHVAALTTLGSALRLEGNLADAHKTILLALEREKTNPHALSVLAYIQQAENKNNEALQTLLFSIQENPRETWPKIQSAAILYEIGETEKALLLAEEVKAVDADNLEASRLTALIQEAGLRYLAAIKAHKWIIKRSSPGDNYMLDSTVALSLLYLLIGKRKNSDAYMRKALRLLKQSPDSNPVQSHNFKNNQAYSCYLELLSKNRERTSEIANTKPSRKIIFMGDSHCLALANEAVSIKGKSFLVISRLIKGAKAWHLGNPYSNIYKSKFSKIAREAAIMGSEHLLIAFGEIDCRFNEGITRHASKYNKPPLTVARETAQMYLEFICEQTKQLPTELILFTPPAPCRRNMGASHFEEVQQISKTFSHEIASLCQHKGIALADANALTTNNENGINTGEMMLDDYHMKPLYVRRLIEE